VPRDPDRLGRIEVTIEKRKWDGSVAARWTARLLETEAGRLCWLAPAGTRRDRPRRGEVEVLASPEIGATEAGAWWVVTAHADGSGQRLRYKVDAATPLSRPSVDTLVFVDLDLDLQLDAGSEELQDAAQFARRAREMGYPAPVRDGAWRGLDEAVRRFRQGRWPFDGSLAKFLVAAA
jgi:hypothetical protein